MPPSSAAAVWAQRACGDGRSGPKPVEPPCAFGPPEEPGAGGRLSGAGRGEEAALLELLGGGAGGGMSSSGGVGAGGGSSASHW